jgi:hypothetical protein
VLLHDITIVHRSSFLNLQPFGSALVTELLSKEGQLDQIRGKACTPTACTCAIHMLTKASPGNEGSVKHVKRSNISHMISCPFWSLQSGISGRPWTRTCGFMA